MEIKSERKAAEFLEKKAGNREKPILSWDFFNSIKLKLNFSYQKKFSI